VPEEILALAVDAVQGGADIEVCIARSFSTGIFPPMSSL